MAAAETDGVAHADSSVPAASTITVAATRAPDALACGAQFDGCDPVVPGLLNAIGILPGPASSLYGCDGVAGGVSVHTADPEDLAGKGHEAGGGARRACDSDHTRLMVNAVAEVRSGRISILGGYKFRDGHELKPQGCIDVTNVWRTSLPPSRRDQERCPDPEVRCCLVCFRCLERCCPPLPRLTTANSQPGQPVLR